jgi:NarL family two-component system response regulator YdfI
VIRVLVASGRGAALASRLGAEKRLHLLVAAAGISPDEQIEDAQPDVVLIDLGSERVSDWLREATTSGPPPALVVLADDMPGVLETGWLRHGGRAVLPRRAATQEIVATIEAVAAGLIVLHPDAGPPGGSPRRRATAVAQSLTSREIEVLGMMAEGLGNKGIAARLGISLHTVKFHIASIFAKLDVESRTEAVTVGVRRGLVLV